MSDQALPITVLGSINIDLFTYVKQLPVLGETCQGKEFKEFAGGKGANQAVAIAKLGGIVTLIGCVGTDSFAPRLIENLKKVGVAIDHVRSVTGIASGMASIWVNQDGENSIIVVPGANGKVNTQDIEHAFTKISRSQFLLAQLECPLKTVTYAFARVKADAPNVKTVLNPAPAMPLTEQLLKQTDILIANETELALLAQRPVTDLESARRAGQTLLKGGSKEIIVTLGPEGALYLNATEEFYQPAIPVTAINTTAAGDSFIGAYLKARGNGKTNPQALSFATQVAAFTVTQEGAQDSIPTHKELHTFLKSHTSSSSTSK